MEVSTCVLVVDDNRNDVFFLRRAFHRAGLMTDFLDVPDGVLAVEYLRGSPPYNDRGRFPFPSLLVLDIRMPKTTGFEVLAWIATRPELKNLPALVLTSSSVEADRETAFRLGAREFLVKPNDSLGWVLLAQGLHHRWLGSERIWTHLAVPREMSLNLSADERKEISDAAVRGGLFG